MSLASRTTKTLEPSEQSIGDDTFDLEESTMEDEGNRMPFFPREQASAPANKEHSMEDQRSDDDGSRPGTVDRIPSPEHSRKHQPSLLQMEEAVSFAPVECDSVSSRATDSSATFAPHVPVQLPLGIILIHETMSFATETAS
jgi:hypothetical protein